MMTKRAGAALLLVALCLAAGCAAGAAAPPIDVNAEWTQALLATIRADDELVQYMVSIRRELHSIPETMYEEFETGKLIQRELGALGIPFTSGIGKTGIIGTIGSGGGPVVALRTDIDALPLEEEADVAFRSTHPGRMHACGHDVHMTMLLGAARMLKRMEVAGDLGAGTVKLVFQPAEEGGAGARYMLEHLTDASAIYGMHVWPSLPTGEVATRVGTIMASAAFFRFTFKGKGTHGAMPHLGRDPVVAAAAAIQSLQTLVSRSTSPFDAAVVSVTKFDAGKAYNVIPDQVTIGGTMRALTEESMAGLFARAEAVVRHVAGAHGCDAIADFMQDEHPVTPPVVNTPAAFERARTIGDALVGAVHVHADVEPSMAAEDFSYYTQKMEGAFVFLGIRNETLGSTFPLHHPKFVADENVMPIGAAMHTALAATTLGTKRSAKNEL